MIQVYDGDGVEHHHLVGGRYGVRFMHADGWFWVGRRSAWGSTQIPVILDQCSDPSEAWSSSEERATIWAKHLREPTAYACPFEGWCLSGRDSKLNDIWFVGITDNGLQNVDWLITTTDRRFARVYTKPEEARRAHMQLGDMGRDLYGPVGWGQ